MSGSLFTLLISMAFVSGGLFGIALGYALKRKADNYKKGYRAGWSASKMDEAARRQRRPW